MSGTPDVRRVEAEVRTLAEGRSDLDALLDELRLALAERLDPAQVASFAAGTTDLMVTMRLMVRDKVPRSELAIWAIVGQEG